MSNEGKNSLGPEPEGKSENGQVSRRDFFSEVAAGALSVAAVGATIVTIKYLSPNVLFEPPTRFRVGTPDDFPLNSVTYFQDQKVYIVRTRDGGFFAETAVCTHLGCITQWNPEAGQIQCPCHGSKFNRDGKVENGPAPKPLPHFALRLMPDGTLMVDTQEIVEGSQVLKL
ncbi:MAG: ubiquinol-cytochrome c reductase iron-sulfur subunit [Deltaproteobacteria bacterium]